MSSFLFKLQELVFEMKEKLTEKQFLEFNHNLLKSFEQNETMIESLKKKELYKKKINLLLVFFLHKYKTM